MRECGDTDISCGPFGVRVDKRECGDHCSQDTCCVTCARSLQGSHSEILAGRSR